MEQSQSKMEKGYDPISAWKREFVFGAGRTFPNADVLSVSEGNQLKGLLESALYLGPGSTNQEIMDALYQLSHRLGGVSDDKDIAEAEMTRYFNEADIKSDTVVVLFPYEGAFNSGVRMARTEILTHFDDLWYPSADDMIVVDVSAKSILHVTHHRWVQAMKYDCNFAAFDPAQ